MRLPGVRLVALVLVALQALGPNSGWSQPTPRAEARALPTAPAAGATLGRRLALIVGNDNYKDGVLNNAVKDARLVAETLRALGFEVMLAEDLNLRDFKTTIRRFLARMENEDGVALFYYAGHGLQLDGRNYLLPVDVGSGDEHQVRDESVDLEEALMARLSRTRKRERIIVLDACRTNPFRQPKQPGRGGIPRGFAQMATDEKGTMIVYSTSPGHNAEDGTGVNSIFAQYFVQEIQREGIEASAAMRSVFAHVDKHTKGRQTPWINSSLARDFYFKPPTADSQDERRKREMQERIDAAIAEHKRDEAARIAAVIAAREKERDRESAERERILNVQMAEMKALLERRDRDLEQARMQLAMATQTRDAQLVMLAQVLQKAPRDREPLPAAPDIRAVGARIDEVREGTERAAREVETQQRLATIEEGVRRRTEAEYEALGKTRGLPFRIASLAVTEPPKVIVPGSNGDFLVRGIRLPADVAIRPLAPDVPDRCRAFLGAWGGGRWNGERTAEIWVESIDADCRAKAIYARGGLGMSGEVATYLRGEGTVRGDTLRLDFESARIELTKNAAGMTGYWQWGTGWAKATFVKIPPQPDRTVDEFANETEDSGASPTRVLSNSQVNGKDRPLPKTVPSVDTLTTVQLDAFLKAHPDAVLVDAIVEANRIALYDNMSHKTIPGAYWMPEIGGITLGALELDLIAKTMRAATNGDPSRPVIVFERSSMFGWLGYRGVLRLMGMGYSTIYWYRGGIDAWHDAAFPTVPSKSWARAS